MVVLKGFGVTLGVGVDEEPGVPSKPDSPPAITVPVPRVAVNVKRIEFCVSVAVARVGLSVGLLITGVFVGARVSEGNALRVCWERTAAVAFKSGAGGFVTPGC